MYKALLNTSRFKPRLSQQFRYTENHHMTQQVAPRYTPQRTENRGSSKYVFTHVHSSLIRESQEVETTAGSIDSRLDAQQAPSPDGGYLATEGMKP